MLRHIAIIPDGNRRWAKEHTLPTSIGHERGVDALKKILKNSFKYNIEYLSFWGSSLSNLTMRPKREVGFLNKLYEENFKKVIEEPDIHEHQVRIRVFGEWETVLNSRAKSAIVSAIEATEKYSKFSLNFLIAYDGTIEMVKAVKKVIETVQVQPDMEITPELIKSNLYTRDIPPVDLLIRTGGEPHLSAGFLMWDITEAQLYFTDKYWPEFTEDDLEEAIAEYRKRNRRFGR